MTVFMASLQNDFFNVFHAFSESYNLTGRNLLFYTLMLNLPSKENGEFMEAISVTLILEKQEPSPDYRTRVSRCWRSPNCPDARLVELMTTLTTIDQEMRQIQQILVAAGNSMAQSSLQQTMPQKTRASIIGKISKTSSFAKLLPVRQERTVHSAWMLTAISRSTRLLHFQISGMTWG